MEIGRYYENQGHYLAAINRFRRVIEKYQTTTHVPEALHRLTECYLALGIKDEAQAAAAVLGYNFPGSEWYQDSYTLLVGENLQPQEKERSEEHTSELQSLMRISYAVFCLKKKKRQKTYK